MLRFGTAAVNGATRPGPERPGGRETLSP
jgi:hypothetical protein